MPALNGCFPLQIAPHWRDFALIALHVVGALYHRFILRDGTLGRMCRAQG